MDKEGFGEEESDLRADLDFLLASAHVIGTGSTRTEEEFRLFRINMDYLCREISKIEHDKVPRVRISNMILVVKNLVQIADDLLPWHKKEIIFSLANISYNYSDYKKNLEGKKSVALLYEIINSEKFEIEHRKYAIELCKNLVIDLNSIGNIVGKRSFEILIETLKTTKEQEIVQTCSEHLQEISEKKNYHIPAISIEISKYLRDSKVQCYKKESIFELATKMNENRLSAQKRVNSADALANLTIQLLEMDEKEFESGQNILEKKTKLIHSYKTAIKSCMNDEETLIGISNLMRRIHLRTYGCKNVVKNSLEVLCDLLYATDSYQSFERIKKDLTKEAAKNTYRREIIAEYIAKLGQKKLEPNIVSKNFARNTINDIINSEAMTRQAIWKMSKKYKYSGPELHVSRVRMN